MRRGRDGAETRARIEAEALRLFAEKGVASTSVRDLAQAVGVSEGALYRHFASKEALARELFLSRYAELAQTILSVRDYYSGFTARLGEIVRLACALFDEEPALFGYLLINQHDHLVHVPAVPEANAVAALALVLEDAAGEGASLPQPAELAAALTLGMVIQPAVFAVYGRLERPLAAHAPAITQGILRMLGAPAPKQEAST
nr:TetR/AcrR family transcriptional regulator [Ancylobacter gelatini]